MLKRVVEMSPEQVDAEAEANVRYFLDAGQSWPRKYSGLWVLVDEQQFVGASKDPEVLEREARTPAGILVHF